MINIYWIAVLKLVMECMDLFIKDIIFLKVCLIIFKLKNRLLLYYIDELSEKLNIVLAIKETPLP